MIFLKIQKAKDSLKFYRNFNPESKDDQDTFIIEFDKLKTIAQQNKEAEGLRLMDFC